jgi:alpha-tubulin suppressor-like RCC1 family protein
MSITRPTGEQITFTSSKTGTHNLDEYLEAVEQGVRTLPDMIEDLFYTPADAAAAGGTAGQLRLDFVEFRDNPNNGGQLQYRVGQYANPSSGWVTINNQSFTWYYQQTIIYADQAQDWAVAPSTQPLATVNGAHVYSAKTYAEEADTHQAQAKVYRDDSLLYWTDLSNNPAVTTLYNNFAKLTAIEANLSDITTVSTDLLLSSSKINAVGGSITNVNLVGSSITDVNTIVIPQNLADIGTVATDLALGSSSIMLTSVTAAAAAATSETNAATSETNAATSATNAATSETNASASETDALASKNSATSSASSATASQAAALASKNAASTSATAASASASAASASEASASSSETNASSSETNASSSETNALSHKTAAGVSETNALAHKNAAATSETNAATSEANALTSKTAAATSATAALAFKNAASTSETNAATSATSALSSKNAAATSATNAATSETNAATSAADAATSLSNLGSHEANAAASAASALSSKNAAATSETNALSSKNAAATSASTAQTAAAAAESSLDNFDDRFLGVKSSDPTLDNDGNALLDGALYYDTVIEVTKVYDQTNTTWLQLNLTATQHTAISNALANMTAINAAPTEAANAAASATAASTSETNALASKNAASSSASSAASSSSSAATSSSSALSSKNAALTSATNAASSASSASSDASSASASASAAAASYDNFDDRYLGAKSSDPTTDNDGNTLITGALYFNSTSGTMKIWDGTVWVSAFVSMSGALLSTNDLSDVSSPSSARTNLGLTTGTLANNVVQLDANAKLPAVDASQLSNLPPSGGAVVAVASGALANGDKVVLRSDGKVEAVASIVPLGIDGYSSGLYTYNVSPTRVVVAAVPNDPSKFLIHGYGLTNGSKNQLMVATVSGNSISFGSVLTLPSYGGNRLYSSPDISFDPANPNTFVFIGAKSFSTPQLACVGNISGTTVTCGAFVPVPNTPSIITNWTNRDVAFDLHTPNRFVIIFSQSLVVGVISGTTITYETPVAVSGNNFEDANIVCDPHTAGRFLIYMGGNGAGARVIMVDSSNIITIGSNVTPVRHYTQNTSFNILDAHMAFDPNVPDRFIIGFTIQGHSAYNLTYDFGVQAGTLTGSGTGTQLAMSSTYTFHTGGTSGSGTFMWQGSVAFNPSSTGVFVVFYRQYSSSSSALRLGTIIEGTLTSANVISYGSPIVVNSNGQSDLANYEGGRESIAFGSNGRFVGVYVDPQWSIGGTTDHAKAFVAQSTTSISSLSASNYLGISNAAYADGATATIQTTSAVASNQSGLTIGEDYYVLKDGTLSTTPDPDYEVYTGIATSTTDLAISLERAGTLNDIDIGTSANKLVQLDSSARLPNVDGSQLTDLPSQLVESTAIASGALSTGDKVILRSDGKVEVIETVISQAADIIPHPAPNQQVFHNNALVNSSVTYLPHLDCDYYDGVIVIAYRDHGGYSYSSSMEGWVVVGLVTGTTIAFGTPVKFDTYSSSQPQYSSVQYPNVKFVPNSNSEFVLVWRTYASGATGNMAAMAGSIASGTSTITLGSKYTASNPGVQYCATDFDPNNPSEFVTFIQNSNGPACYHMSLSAGLAITMRSPVYLPTGFGATNSGVRSIAFSPDIAGLFLLSLKPSMFVVGTITSGTLAFGTYAQCVSALPASNFSRSVVAFDPNVSGQFVAAIQDDYTSYAYAINAVVGNISGTTISFGPQVQIGANAYPVLLTDMAFDRSNSMKSRFITFYTRYSSYAHNSVVNEVVGGSIVTPVGAITYMGWAHDHQSTVAIDPITGSVVMGGSVNQTAIMVMSQMGATTSTHNLTASNYLGVSKGSYPDGSTATIQTANPDIPTADGQSGLTIDADYYVQKDGTVSVTPDPTYNVYAGKAISSTSLGLGLFTNAERTKLSGIAAGATAGGESVIGTNSGSTYADGQLFVSGTGIAYWKLNDGAEGWYEVGALLATAGSYEDSIACGVSHSVIIKSDSTVWSVGYNTNGQLGDGTTTLRTSFVSSGISATKVACGDYYTIVIKPDGTVWGIGNNNEGQLGDGTTTARSSFVSSGISATKVACGYAHTMVIKSDGTLWGVGRNADGLLGDGTTTTPRLSFVSSGISATDVACGGASHTVAIKPDGTVWSTGNGYYGNLGHGGSGHTAHRSTFVSSGISALKVDCGSYFTVVIKSDGTVWSVGYNSNGQLGDGTTTSRSTFVSSGISATKVACGNDHTIVIKPDGTVWGAGRNNNGQLGDGTTYVYRTSYVSSGISATEVYCGKDHTIAIKSDGTVWGTGVNSDGQLGRANQTNTSSFSSSTTAPTPYAYSLRLTDPANFA